MAHAHVNIAMRSTAAHHALLTCHLCLHPSLSMWPLRLTPPPAALLCSALLCLCSSAGVTLAHYLESSTSYRIILIEKRDYFEYTPSMLRVMREPDHMAVSHLRYDDLRMLQRPRVTIVQDEVVAVRQGAVVTKSGDTIAYDKLVLAMGSDYPGEETNRQSDRQHSPPTV